MSKACATVCRLTMHGASRMRGSEASLVGGGRWGHIVGQHHVLLRVHGHLPPIRQLGGDDLPEGHRRLPHLRHGPPHGHQRVGGLPPAVYPGALCAFDQNLF